MSGRVIELRAGEALSLFRLYEEFNRYRNAAQEIDAEISATVGRILVDRNWEKGNHPWKFVEHDDGTVTLEEVVDGKQEPEGSED